MEDDRILVSYVRADFEKCPKGVNYLLVIDGIIPNLNLEDKSLIDEVEEVVITILEKVRKERE